jgi:hypothetical protein
MTLYRACMPQFRQMLLNLRTWLGTGEEHARATGRDPEALLSCQLAPDQFPLLRQIQAACDTSKLVVARLTGKQAPKHDDTEKTLAEIRTRIDATLAYLETIGADDFEGADEKKIALFWDATKTMRGEDYLHEFSLANFYFHVTTAYAILRHEGVPLGKFDYIGRLTTQSAT